MRVRDNMRIHSDREGFSLIELIISIAIVAIVMSSVLVLITYSTNSMRRTTNMVTLQNQTKDAVTHITTYLQEGSEAHWDDANKALIVVKYHTDSAGNKKSADIGYYWQDSTNKILYFYKTTCKEFKGVDIPALDSEGNIDWAELTQSYSSLQANNLVFAKNVIDFKCESLQDISKSLTTVTTPTEPGTTPVPTKVPLSSISEDAWRVTINMKNETEDAEFSSTKDVHMRNQL